MGRFNNFKNIVVTGGAGFIGGAFIRRIIKNTDRKIFNFDKCSYASNLKSLIEFEKFDNYKLIKLDLINFEKINKKIEEIEPDLIIHFAAESHVDRSINDPKGFIESNILGTFNIIESARKYWEKLTLHKQKLFLFHHVSTDEVFGSLQNKEDLFSESSSYDPRSPYSASKASSDHIVRAWFHTYKLPITLTNCSNNFGPWQFPEKLMPLAITNALEGKKIPLYGDGMNIRDWLFVEDHISAILKVIDIGKIGETYCIGSKNEKSNIEVVTKICEILDNVRPNKNSYMELIRRVKDRPGHDRRYGIDPSKIYSELSWQPKYSFEESLELTIKWYIDNEYWWKK